MLNDLFESIRDSFRYRFGPTLTTDDRPTAKEDREALRRHNDAEARIVGCTMADPDGIRAFGKGRPH